MADPGVAHDGGPDWAALYRSYTPALRRLVGFYTLMPYFIERQTLLAGALRRAAAGASALGGRYVVVDAIDDEAGSFYEHHGFAPVPGYANRLLLPTKALEPYLHP